MEVNVDQEYQDKAIELLDRALSGCLWDLYIDKKILIAMYSESNVILNQKTKSRKLAASAESVSTSIIRIVRCLCIDDEKAKETMVRGRMVQLDAEAIYNSVVLEYRNMKQLNAKSKKFP
jgi:hypothetical protein